MDKWTEIKTAYKLAKLGTLSATAQSLGIHRSTVMRHIDALEDNLGVVLFQRNDKGYIPTEAGLDLMRLGEVTDNQFSQLISRLKSQEQILEGKLTITIVSDIISMIMPSIYQYQTEYPCMQVEVIGDLRNFKLEYGEADIAIRGGDKPTTPDNIVLPLLKEELILCAHQNYIDRHGKPTQDNLNQHKFVALNERPPHLIGNEWIYENVPDENIVLRGNDSQILFHGVKAGSGIGFMPAQMIERNSNLHPIPSSLVWDVEIWVLIHRDMFNMPKIRKFLDILKAQKDWPMDSL